MTSRTPGCRANKQPTVAPCPNAVGVCGTYGVDSQLVTDDHERGRADPGELLPPAAPTHLSAVGVSRLCDITPAQVTAWTRELSAAGYPRSTVSSQIKLLSMMLIDAMDARLIVANPVRLRRNRGRRHHAPLVERVWAIPDHVVRIAAQAATLGGPTAELLIITAAWTGGRWAELTGLRRANVHLDDGCLVVDPLIGALHESGARLWLGPPKPSASVRTISLLPFLVELLRRHVDHIDGPRVFPSVDGDWLRRSNFTRRALRPAATCTSRRRECELHRSHPAARSTACGTVTRPG